MRPVGYHEDIAGDVLVRGTVKLVADDIGGFLYRCSVEPCLLFTYERIGDAADSCCIDGFDRLIAVTVPL